MKRILITGALGYLGGRISQYLDARPGYVLSLGTSRRDERRPQWLRHGDVVSLDVLSDADTAAACDGVDTIVHLAALNEIDSAADPERALAVTVGGTLKLLAAARKAKVSRFIYFSTAHVYGAPLAGHITEQALPRPVHPYAITHRSAEDFVLAARSSGGVEGVVVRLSNAVGAPHDASVNRWTLLVNDLCKQAVTGKQLVLKSAGTQYRDFICFHDVCRIVEHLIALPANLLGDGLFNVGGQSSLQVRAVAEMIAERCSVTLGFRPVLRIPDAPASGNTPEQLHYDVSKLLATGYSLIGDITAEIDDTLSLCKRAFSNQGVS